MHDKNISVQAARQADAIGRQVTLRGWIRTRRDSKGGFSFLELNDGSSLANLQIIAEAALPNYEAEIKRLAAGCSVTIDGEVDEEIANRSLEWNLTRSLSKINYRIHTDAIAEIGECSVSSKIQSKPAPAMTSVA